MTPHPSHAHDPRLAPAKLAAGLRDLVGPMLFALVLLLVFITLSPFPDRSDAGLLGAQEGGDLAKQIVFPLAALCVAGYVSLTRPWVWHVIYHPILIVLAGWLVITVITSIDPGLSARRTLFSVLVIVIGALVAALPRTRDEFADILAGVAMTVLVISWIGIVVAPERSMHLVTDVIERDLAGDWAGFYQHKNETGSVMVCLIFIGLFYAQVRNVPIGWAISAFAAVFLYFTKSKTPLGLLPLIWAISMIIPRLRSIWSRGAVAFVLLGVLNLATIGSSSSGPVRSVVQRILPDATFTGRTDLWAFAIENIAAKPVFGHGYGGFWRTSAVLNQERGSTENENQDNWFIEGTQAHNSYLDIALLLGIPGLLIVLAFVMIIPLRDYQRIVPTPENAAIRMLFVRLWLFTLYLSSLESILMVQSSQAWFMMLIAIFGFRMLAAAPVKTEPAP
jgi:O-antigen ligase